VSVVVIGLNHRTAPLPLLERVTLRRDGVPKALHDLAERPNISEVVVLSTCNRTEVYAVAERFHGAYGDIRDFLCQLGGLAPEDVHDHLYSQHDDEAVRHLFSVAAGLESAVVGETEILGQVRSAWELAQEHGAARGVLNLAFRHAVEAGKRARTETGISRSTASVSHAAVEMISELSGPLGGARVAVVGAGEMGEGVAVALAAAGPADMVVVNRTPERASTLAARTGGRCASFDDLATVVAESDIVVSSTGADVTVITRDLVEVACRQRADRSLLLVDIAVPRNVDAGVGEIDGVTLLDLDDLRDWARRGTVARLGEVESVRRIVAEELDRYTAAVSARQAAPLVSELRRRAEDVRQAELRRFAAKLAALDDDQRAAVEALTQGIVAKLLHGPSVTLKDQAGTPAGERLSSAVRDLFDLS
jgi:glutamyl-tRNA reductase